MYTLRVEQVFSAAHAILIQGERERLHGHDWRVRVEVGGESLDGDGLLCDFHLIERLLNDVLSPWRDSTLNEVEPFTHLNPTAEKVAETIASQLAPHLPSTIEQLTVRVTEAPGCEAAFSSRIG